ncbi:hypothetical protein ACHAWF_004276 [Thalassiosira exigua]
MNDVERCVETRWNDGSIGSPSGRGSTSWAGRSSVVRVRRYDEEWEVPAGLALLQLITPAGMIPNSTQK